MAETQHKPPFSSSPTVAGTSRPMTTYHAMAARFSEQGEHPIVEACFLELAEPDIATGGSRFTGPRCNACLDGSLLPAKTTASGRVTLRASSDPACLSHSRQGLGRLSHDSG